ncbi:ABC transporter permease [Aliagarivorans marinus]|uniref:ABC transporter permease n=1 Tax=Aliagarivorans marinus TaxID=561965 RepID=UPI000422A9AB|nr:ABC transporter permease [Aliagarivorans marinus]
MEQVIKTPSLCAGRLTWRPSRLAVLLGIVAALVIVALLAPLISPYDFEAMASGPRLSPPSWAHWFGTDEFGRDIFSRILMGTRLTLMVGLVSVGVSLGFGMLIGLIAGYCGGWPEKLLMRGMDVLFSFTEIVIALSLVAVLGPSLENAMLAIGIAAIPFYARVCYGAVLVEKKQVYVESTIALGASHFRVLFVHILPNVVPVMLVVATIGLSNAILATSGLSYLGLGAQPPSPEWGAMLASSKNYFQRAPWLLMIPGGCIVLIVLLFNVLGEQLRSVLDPRRKGES